MLHHVAVKCKINYKNKLLLFGLFDLLKIIHFYWQFTENISQNKYIIPVGVELYTFMLDLQFALDMIGKTQQYIHNMKHFHILFIQMEYFARCRNRLLDFFKR